MLFHLPPSSKSFTGREARGTLTNYVWRIEPTSHGAGVGVVVMEVPHMDSLWERTFCSASVTSQHPTAATSGFTIMFKLRPCASQAVPSHDWASQWYQSLAISAQHGTPLAASPRVSPLHWLRLCQICISTWGSPCSVLPPLPLCFTRISPNKLLPVLTWPQHLLPREPKPMHWVTTLNRKNENYVYICRCVHIYTHTQYNCKDF